MLVGVLAAAVFCWVMAVRAAFSIAALAPGSSRFGIMQTLGRWDFDSIRTAAGAGVEPHILTFKRAFAGFFVLVLIVVAFSALAYVTGNAAPATPSASS
ncbi:MAG: hypothetical protein ABIO40_06245 [Devosia sp.]